MSVMELQVKLVPPLLSFPKETPQRSPAPPDNSTGGKQWSVPPEQGCTPPSENKTKNKDGVIEELFGPGPLGGPDNPDMPLTELPEDILDLLGESSSPNDANRVIERLTNDIIEENPALPSANSFVPAILDDLDFEPPQVVIKPLVSCVSLSPACDRTPSTRRHISTLKTNLVIHTDKPSSPEPVPSCSHWWPLAPAVVRQIKPSRVDVFNEPVSHEKLQGLAEEANRCGRYYSNDLSEQCFVLCMVCKLQMPLQKLRNHVIYDHDLEYKDYKKKYTIIYSKIVHHRCFECNEDVMLEYALLTTHFKTHGMTLADYKSKFLHSTPKSPVKKKPKSEQVGVEVKKGKDLAFMKTILAEENALVIDKAKPGRRKSRTISIHSEDSSSNKRKRSPSQEISVGVRNPRSKRRDSIRSSLTDESPQNSPSRPEGIGKKSHGSPSPCESNTPTTNETFVRSADEDKIFSTDYNEMCKQRCEICQTEVRQLAVHVYQVHQTFLQDYRKKYGVRDVANLVNHKCGVCGKEMVFNYSTVGTHIRKHKLSFKEYKERYLDSTSPTFIPIEERNFKEVKIEENVDNGSTKKYRKKHKPKFINRSNDDDIKKEDVSDSDKDSPDVRTRRSKTKCLSRIKSELDLEPSESQPTKVKPKVKKLQILVKKEVKQEVVTTEGSSVVDDSGGPSEPNPRYNFINKDGQVFTDVLAEQCVFRCSICDERMNKKRIAKHVVTVHKMSFSNYKNKHGDFVPLQETFYRCKICEMDLLFTYDIVKDHVKGRHKMSFPQYQVDYAGFSDRDTSKTYTNVCQNMCSCHCQICDQIFLHHHFGRHLASAHPGVKTDQYVYVNKAYYRCVVCFEGKNVVRLKNNLGEMLFSKTNIKDHLLHHHPGMTFREYASLPNAFSGDLSLLWTDLSGHVKSEDYFEVAQAQPLANLVDLTWVEGNTFTCLICQQSFANKQRIKNHAKSVHHFNFKDFGTQYTASDVYYACKLCGTEVYHDEESIGRHLAELHSTNIREYTSKHKDTPATPASPAVDDGDSVDGDGPNPETTFKDSDTEADGGDDEDSKSLKADTPDSETLVELNPDEFLGLDKDEEDSCVLEISYSNHTNPSPDVSEKNTPKKESRSKVDCCWKLSPIKLLLDDEFDKTESGEGLDTEKESTVVATTENLKSDVISATKDFKDGPFDDEIEVLELDATQSELLDRGDIQDKESQASSNQLNQSADSSDSRSSRVLNLEGKLITDDFEDRTTSRCLVCGLEGFSDDITVHVNQDHSNALGRRLKYIKKTYHRCRLCEKVMLFVSTHLENHLSRFHDLSIIEYCNDNILPNNIDEGNSSKVVEENHDSSSNNRSETTESVVANELRPAEVIVSEPATKPVTFNDSPSINQTTQSEETREKDQAAEFPQKIENDYQKKDDSVTNPSQKCQVGKENDPKLQTFEINKKVSSETKQTFKSKGKLLLKKRKRTGSTSGNSSISMCASPILMSPSPVSMSASPVPMFVSPVKTTSPLLNEHGAKPVRSSPVLDKRDVDVSPVLDEQMAKKVHAQFLEMDRPRRAKRVKSYVDMINGVESEAAEDSSTSKSKMNSEDSNNKESDIGNGNSFTSNEIKRPKRVKSYVGMFENYIKGENIKNKDDLSSTESQDEDFDPEIHDLSTESQDEDFDPEIQEKPSRSRRRSSVRTPVLKSGGLGNKHTKEKLYTCYICNEITSRAAIFVHFRSFHPGQTAMLKEISPNEYKKNNLSSESKAPSFKNEISTQNNIDSKSTADVVDTLEALSTEDEGKSGEDIEHEYTDDLNLLTTVSCDLCGEVMGRDLKASHFRMNHPKMNIATTIKRKTYHKCKLCGKGFRFCPESMRPHLRKWHAETSWDLYCSKYLISKAAKDSGNGNKFSEDSMSKAAESRDQTETWAVKKVDVKLQRLQKKDLSEENLIDIQDELNRVAENQNTESEGENGEIRVHTDDINQMSLYKCNYCEQILKLNNLYTHCHRNHPNQPFVKTLIRESYHRCKLCDLSLEFTMRHLTTHFRCEHNGELSWSDYKVKFLKNADTDQRKLEERRKFTTDGLAVDQSLTTTLVVNEDVCEEKIKSSKELEKKDSSDNEIDISETRVRTDDAEQMTTNEYKAKFLKTADIDLRYKHKKSTADALEGDKSVGTMSTDVIKDEGEENIKAPVEFEKDDTADDSIDDCETRVYTDDLNKLSLYKCNYCEQILKLNILQTHSRRLHPNKPFAKTSFRKSYHRCKLCEHSFNFTMNNIDSHLRRTHNGELSWSEYKAKFLKNADLDLRKFQKRKRRKVSKTNDSTTGSIDCWEDMSTEDQVKVEIKAEVKDDELEPIIKGSAEHQVEVNKYLENSSSINDKLSCNEDGQDNVEMLTRKEDLSLAKESEVKLEGKDEDEVVLDDTTRNEVSCCSKTNGMPEKNESISKRRSIKIIKLDSDYAPSGDSETDYIPTEEDDDSVPTEEEYYPEVKPVIRRSLKPWPVRQIKLESDQDSDSSSKSWSGKQKLSIEERRSIKTAKRLEADLFAEDRPQRKRGRPRKYLAGDGEDLEDSDGSVHIKKQWKPRKYLREGMEQALMTPLIPIEEPKPRKVFTRFTQPIPGLYTPGLLPITVLETTKVPPSKNLHTTGLLATDQQPITSILTLEQQPITGLLTTEQQPITGLLTTEQQPITGLLTKEQQPITGLLSTEQQPITSMLTTEQPPITCLLTSEQQPIAGMFKEQQPITGLLSTEQQTITGLLRSEKQPITGLILNSIETQSNSNLHTQVLQQIKETEPRVNEFESKADPMKTGVVEESSSKDEIASLSGSDTVFLCPFLLEGCQSVATKEGLTGGLAVKHCMTAHRTPPRKLKRLRLSWKKVEKSCVDFKVFAFLE